MSDPPLPDPASESLLASRVRVPDNVVYRSFATETVALNTRSGQYHGLNPTAGRMLELLAERMTIAQAAARVADEYDQPRELVERDICALCSGLAARGLVEIDASGDE